MNFSLIEGNSHVVGETTMADYVSMIKQPSLRVMEYRELMGSNPTRAELKKRSMPAITPAGTFKEKRLNETLIDYSGMICLDIDHKQNIEIDINRLKADLVKDKYVVAVHLSLSGTGLAVFMIAETGAEMHLSAYAQAADYISKKYKIKVDPACKDISRQRYLSHDPDIHYNLNAVVFKVMDPGIFDTILDQIRFTENLHKMEDGSRNIFLLQLSCNCARRGLPIQELKHYSISRYTSPDFSGKEIINTIDSGYKQVDRDDGDDGGQSAHSAVNAVAQDQEIYVNHQFEDWIFPKLPSFLQGYDLITSTKIQKDIVLITNLGLLSACLPYVHTILNGARTYPNLYFFIYAPPASDKGKMGIISKMADPLDSMLSDECAKKKKAFAASGKNETTTVEDELDEPKCKGLFLDADSSSIAMIQSLDQGKENLLIDTEAVILSQNRKNDWAQLDPHLRKAYHFERISVSRKDRTIMIREPRISVLISGTVEDAKVFSGSIQGGLTSRILPYSFSAPMEWQSQFSEESSRIPAFIDAKSSELIAIYLFNKEHPFELKFTDSQKQKHTETFGEWTEELDSGDQFAFLKRLGVATVRLVMILMALRRAENKNLVQVMLCDDDIFEIALSIANTFRGQGDNFYKLITQKAPQALPRVQKVLDAIPKEFETQQFITHSKQILHINDRQAKNHLKMMVRKGVLTHIKQGVYEKV